MYFQLQNITRSLNSQEAMVHATHSAVARLEEVDRGRSQTMSPGDDDPDARIVNMIGGRDTLMQITSRYVPTHVLSFLFWI